MKPSQGKYPYGWKWPNGPPGGPKKVKIGAKYTSLP